MTRNDLMEKMYRNNPQVSAGEICLALAKRFPRWQGEYYAMANKFIKAKKEAYYAQKNAKESLNKRIGKELSRFTNAVSEAFKGMTWELHLPN